MKKAKNTIIFILALIPLICTFLPYILAFTSDVRPDTPEFGSRTITKLSNGNYTVSSLLPSDQAYGLSGQLLSGFIRSTTSTKTFDKSTDPVGWAMVGFCYTFQTQLSMSNPSILIYSMYYLLYLFVLELCDIVMSFMTWIPRKLNEMMMR